MGAGVTPSHAMRVTSSHTVLSSTGLTWQALDGVWSVLHPGPEGAVLKGSEDGAVCSGAGHTLWAEARGKGHQRQGPGKQRLQTQGMDTGRLMGTGPGEIRTDGAGGLETRLPGSEGSLRSSGENGSSRELAGGSQVGGGPELGAKPQVAAERLALVSASSEQQLLQTPCPHPCSGIGASVGHH